MASEEYISVLGQSDCKKIEGWYANEKQKLELKFSSPLGRIKKGMEDEYKKMDSWSFSHRSVTELGLPKTGSTSSF